MALPVQAPPAHWRQFAFPLASTSTAGDVCVGCSSGLRMVLVALGVMPVSLIALSTFGVGLRGAALRVALPALVVVAVLSGRRRASSTLVRGALLAGLAATALYDVSRLAFMWLGVVDHDPIPHIGTELGLDPPVVFGYLWRYAGNGAGLALTFLALGLRGTRAGVLYGLAVCGGLLLILAVSPYGQEMLFPVRIGTVLMTTTGHVLFGAVLGSLSQRWASGTLRWQSRTARAG